jgi:hypothetical protein
VFSSNLIQTKVIKERQKKKNDKKNNSRPLGVSSSVALEALGDFGTCSFKQRKKTKKTATSTLPHAKSLAMTKVKYLSVQITRTLPTPWRSPLALLDTT